MEPLMKNMDNCDVHYRYNTENLGEIDENH
jgi:hypothetical protein